MSLYQKYRPSDGRTSLVIGDEFLDLDDILELPTIHYGTPDMTRAEKPAVWMAGAEGISSNGWAALFSVDKKVHFVFDSQSSTTPQIDFLKLETSVEEGFLEGTIQFAHKAFEEDSLGKRKYVLAVSRDLGQRHASDIRRRYQTAFLIFEADRTQAYPLQSIMFPGWYYQKEELFARIHGFRSEADLKIAFDKNSKFPNVKAYESMTITSALINLETSTPSRPDYVYKAPLFEQRYLGGRLVYREYDLDQTADDTTGFYTTETIHRKNGRGFDYGSEEEGSTQITVLKKMQKGLARLPGLKKKTPNSSLMIEKISLHQSSWSAVRKGGTNPDNDQAITLAVMPFTDNFKDAGTSMFKLGLYFQHDDTDVTPTFLSVPISHPYSALAGVKVIQGRRAFENFAVLLVF